MENIIVKKIKQSPKELISYADFIELVLYHPIHGYYKRDQIKVGKSGDFITTSNISDIFGAIFSKWFFKLVEEKQLSPEVCEIGAGNGRFAKAFIDSWEKHSSIPLAYNIIETSPFHRKLQQELLPMGNGVSQVNDLAEIKPFNGLIFSNELFDALPVYVIEKREGQLFEIMIGLEGIKLVEKPVPLSNSKILSFLKEHNISLVNNQRIEIPLEMENMIKTISDSLGEGLVITIDYGYSREEWREPARRSGSLRGYYKHQMMSNVLQHFGEMDITHHIHWDPFIAIGEQLNLHYISKKRQDEFLLAAGILQELEENYDPNPFSEKSKRNRAIRSLVLPGMSSFFHVVIQQKNLGLLEEDLF